MTWRGFFEGLGDFFQWAFQGLTLLGNVGNLFFIAAGTILGIYWIREMMGHQRRGEQ
jgi:hypothetical protein